MTSGSIPSPHFITKPRLWWGKGTLYWRTDWLGTRKSEEIKMMTKTIWPPPPRRLDGMIFDGVAIVPLVCLWAMNMKTKTMVPEGEGVRQPTAAAGEIATTPVPPEAKGWTTLAHIISCLTSVLDAMTMKMLSVVTMTRTRTTINKRRATMLRNRVPAAESSGEQGVAEDGNSSSLRRRSGGGRGGILGPH